MKDLIKTYKSIEQPFFMEAIEDGTDMEKLRYHGKGEAVYADGRQVLVRSCHDALVACKNQSNEKGILLIARNAEPAFGYLWSLGGFFDRGVSTSTSLASRIKLESGLDVDETSFLVLGHIRAIWKTTPNKEAEAKKLPLGIDDTGLLFFVEGYGNLDLDKLHDRPRIITSKMYTSEFRERLHPYIQMGMDRAIKLI